MKHPIQYVALLSVLALTACASQPGHEKDLSAAVARAAEQPSPQYRHALVDLNDDGTQDAIVLLEGSAWCGSGGCTMLVLQGRDNGYAKVSRSTVTNPPIRVAESRHQGWRDLIVDSDGASRVMRFAGQGYPLNPSMQPAAEQKQTETADIVLHDY